MGENGMQINIIAACDRNGLIGINGKLPWNIPEDLKRFRELTLGHAVIMGRRTHDSIGLGGLGLPKRLNIVITNTMIFGDENLCLSLRSSLSSGITHARVCDHDKAFIIGGERLYAEALPLADRVYLTMVDTEVEVGPEDTVARFPLEQMQGLFRMESEDKRDGFSFTEWVRK
jgi:dihydrofolate reductase